MGAARKRAGENRRPGRVRRVVGDVLIILTLAFTVWLSAVMLYRIRAVALADDYRKVFRYEIVLCAIMLVFSLDLRFNLFTGRRVGRALRAAVIAAVAFVVVLGAGIASGGFIRDDAPSGYAIVPGMALENGRPVRDLLLRVNAARAYAERYPDAVLILTGGNADGDGRTEAAVMRDILTQGGFPGARLLLEERASDTRENFRNAARMIDPDTPITLITSGYHMNRAVDMAREAGFTSVRRLPAPSDPLRYGINVMWEIIIKLDNITKSWRMLWV